MRTPDVHQAYTAGMTATAAVAALAIPLLLWRVAWPLTGWAALALLPLAVAIWLGVYRPLRDRRRAELVVMLRPGSALARWLTGRAGAGLNATITTVVSLPVLGWLALGGRWQVVGMLAAVCVLAAILSEPATRLLARGLSAPYARLAGQRAAALVAALAGMVPLVWINWAVIPVDHAVTAMSLPDAMAAAADALPGPAGWLRDALGVLAALDAAKLWLAAQYRDAAWVGLVFSIDAALVTFISARALVAVQDFVRRTIEGDRP